MDRRWVGGQVPHALICPVACLLPFQSPGTARCHHHHAPKPLSPVVQQHRPAVAGRAVSDGVKAPTSTQQRKPAAQQQQQQGQRQRRQQPRQQQAPAAAAGAQRQQLPKPFIVRIAGRTSSVTGAAGAIVKRLRMEVRGPLCSALPCPLESLEYLDTTKVAPCNTWTQLHH